MRARVLACLRACVRALLLTIVMQVMLGHTEGSGALDSPGLTRFTAGVELHHLFMLVCTQPLKIQPLFCINLLSCRCTTTLWTAARCAEASPRCLWRWQGPSCRCV